MIQQTSLDSFESIKHSLGQRQMEVLSALKNLEIANNTILAKRLNLHINRITPRVLELRELGYVIEAKRDICPITKRMSIFWRVA